MKKATIRILDKDYSSSGVTVKDALMGLQYKGFARLKSTLTVISDEKEKAIFLPPLQTMRLFSINPTIREVGVKQIAMRFE